MLSLRLRRKPAQSKLSKFNRPNKTAIVTLKSLTPVQRVEERYLSFSIDISVVAGGFWWEGSQKTKDGLGTERIPPIDLNQKKLDLLVQALGPAYLRVGGSEADKVHYFTTSRTPSDPAPLIITQQIWDALHQFVERNQLGFMFTFKYGLFNRKQHGDWLPEETQGLLQYCRQKGYKIDVCELGNELNAYWAFHGIRSQPSASKLAKDYDRFCRLVRMVSPESRIAGPGSAFWPKLGETIRPFSNITTNLLANMEEQLDIVDWHYYPFQSKRSPVRTRTATLDKVIAPSSLDDFEQYARQLSRWRNKHQPSATLWTGETGSAQCGGQAKLSDRFASCFWWADQLGRGALLGQTTMVRQSLIGGDYALINRKTLKPNPDYWVSWLWGKLMGQEVYKVECFDPDIQAYCHSGKKEGKCTLLIINMTSKPKRILCHNFGAKKKRFEITAASLTSKKVRINGAKPKFNNGKVKLRDFPKLSKLNLVSPYSINFWCFEHQTTLKETNNSPSNEVYSAQPTPAKINNVIPLYPDEEIKPDTVPAPAPINVISLASDAQNTNED
ncbi:glycoside hydrolase [Marinomonas mediterranea]|uniref:glycoside hydrolase n=1 Tax=Marinomonas mediterranea TaxID=119864 RepID=UPI002349B1C3|nr:glycoside hydrolase [Marinomonas mediterranea]WCN10075.1 glycoside hydrolase [Marinomonas mediterranea]